LVADNPSVRTLIEAQDSDRYHRQRLIPWWDQDRLSRSRVLVVGAGALGNEILKNLALIGVGNTLVVDMDHIERSNLSRSVLFRTDDVGQGKAEAACAAMHRLNPEETIQTHAFPHNLLHSLGLGVFYWADVVIGGLDNREARLFVSQACAMAGRLWVDGAIEGLDGIVRVFDPAQSACYECTMNQTDRQQVAERRSCAMVARHVVAAGHVPTTAVTASMVGAYQVQEAIKILHEQPGLRGEGVHLSGLWNEVSRVRYPRRDDCPGHDHIPSLEPLAGGVSDWTVGAILQRAEERLGPGAVVDLSRDVVTHMECFQCGTKTPCGRVLGAIGEAEAACGACNETRSLSFHGSLVRGGDVEEERTLASLGVPAFDVVVARQGMDRREAWLMAGDAPGALGALTPSWQSQGTGESA